MGWLSSLFGGNEMEELERLIKEAPAPSLFIRLAHLQLQQGNASKAMDVAKKGIERFGDQEELRQLLAEASHVSQMAEVDQIKNKIERFPNPTLYARLATLYLEQNELDACTRTCAIAVKAFPDYAGIYLVMALASRKQKQTDKTIHYLEKAVEMDAYNYAAQMMLAEELTERGKDSEARTRLEMILRFAPEDERVKAMIAHLDQLHAVASQRPDEDTRKLPAVGQAAGVDDSAIERSIACLAEIEGMEASLLVDHAGLIVACRSREESFDEELAAAVVSNVCRAVNESASELGIGDFLEANIEGEFGTLQLMPIKDMILASFAGSAVRAGRLQRAMHGCIQELQAS